MLPFYKLQSSGALPVEMKACKNVSVDVRLVASHLTVMLSAATLVRSLNTAATDHVHEQLITSQHSRSTACALLSDHGWIFGFWTSGETAMLLY